MASIVMFPGFEQPQMNDLGFLRPRIEPASPRALISCLPCSVSGFCDSVEKPVKAAEELVDVVERGGRKRPWLWKEGSRSERM